MRFLSLICTAFALLGAASARAQEPALPEPIDAPTPAPAASATPLPTPLPTPAPQLIPDDVLPEPTASPVAPDLRELDEAFRDAPLNQTMQDRWARIEWRKLRNVVVNEPEVKEALAKAERARTDLEKRRLLRRYYDIYFGKMIALTQVPEFKAYLRDRKVEHLNTLPQPRVRPETARLAAPNSPSPRPQQAAASPSPSPTPRPLPIAPADMPSGGP